MHPFSHNASRRHARVIQDRAQAPPLLPLSDRCSEKGLLRGYRKRRSYRSSKKGHYRSAMLRRRLDGCALFPAPKQGDVPIRSFSVEAQCLYRLAGLVLASQPAVEGDHSHSITIRSFSARTHGTDRKLERESDGQCPCYSTRLSCIDLVIQQNEDETMKQTASTPCSPSLPSSNHQSRELDPARI